MCRNITPNIALFMPRSVDYSQLVELAGPGHICEIEQLQTFGKVKCISAYYGGLVVPPSE